MSIFNRLFAELFKSKTKKAYSMLLIQFVVALALTIITFISVGSPEVAIKNNTFTSFFPGLLATYATLSFLFIPVFYITTCIANERTNRNQTFRLVPISDSPFYLDNILSSFVALAYYGILNVLSIFILFGASYTFDASFRQVTKLDFSNLQAALQRADINFGSDVVFNLLGILMLLILISFFGYFIVSFLNFSSSAILDFLPDVSNKTVLRIIRLVLIIFIAWLLTRANGYLARIIASPLDFFLGTGDNASNKLGISILVMLAIDIVFLVADTFLMSKFFEAREKK
ncbi:hypothetical protein [Lactobacillus xylocopicola]|uniref:ABC transporter permease n=1 Tax=Lactobacillus xylocopicola TaxID=2976676 RepID=A0ABM8BGX4_9LACO|nr:hypothetical protein [Lactobacillus xylocopicola]BDR60524.1 hypothetical protein KIM322_07850 [Lactobacillus xylocopicola]